jgi:hypothetical protein
MKDIPNFEEFLNESSIDGLTSNEQDMVKGIAGIVRQVKDRDNRSSIAKDQIESFKKEGIDFKYEEFLALCDLTIDEFEGSLGGSTQLASDLFLATQTAANGIAF